MATGAYIGALTDTFGYITANNVSSYFNITNGQYRFSFSGNSLSANNLNVNSSTATTTLTAITNISKLIISYSYVTEQNYDRFTLSVGGVTVLGGVSGSNQGTWSGSLSSGQSITLSYSKDSSTSVSGESVTVSLQIPSGSSIRSRKISKIYVGVSSVAHNVKKGYIGVNGKAMQFWGNSPVFGSATVGSVVTMGSYEYIIVHVTSDVVILALRYCSTTRIRFSSGSSSYENSVLYKNLQNWMSNIPEEYQPYLAVDYTVMDVAYPIFAPTYDQLNGGFSYYTSNEARKYYSTGSSSSNGYWSSQYYRVSSADAQIYAINADGEIIHTFAYNRYTYRPHIAMSREAFA